MYKFKILAKL